MDASQRISLGTYFNGFPAGYWRRWTVVGEVRLDLTVSGAGASVIVYRSMANGRSQRVDGWTCETSGPSSVSFDLTLVPFVDGGWYWFDVVAGDEDAVDRGGHLERRGACRPRRGRHGDRRHHHDEPARTSAPR